MGNRDIEKIFKSRVGEKSDINEHLSTLANYGKKVDHITEFGMRHGNSTVAFLYAKPKKFHSYDNHTNGSLNLIKTMAKSAEVDFTFHCESTLDAEIEETDLIFFDTIHSYEHLKQELSRHGSKCRRYMIFHDTEAYGMRGQSGGHGIIKAIGEFLEDNKDWKIKEQCSNNNGLMILQKSPV